MIRYYHLDSSGCEDTNLQLYSLKQAKLQWDELERKVSNVGLVSNLHERCVFIIIILGVSISQLLGQNNPYPSNRVPTPKDIFKSLVQKHSLSDTLISEFENFIDAYNSCRHFGLTTDGSRHAQVSKFTYEETLNLYNFGLKVWDVVISIYKKDPDNDLQDLDLQNIEKKP
ncbi:hypothetical protein [Halomonas sp. H5]|uniref:hypothetical protein n=1 Tax=Halomonas sp. H5 TaxID=3423910 RepID=UPI003D35C3F6